MAKLRMTVGSLRRMVCEMTQLLEAEDDPKHRAPERRLRRSPPSRVVPPEPTKWKSAGAKPNDPSSPLASGSGKVKSTAVKQNPGYDPLLPKAGGRSPGWLAIYDPDAFNALKRMGTPEGKIFTDGPYVMFKPADPTQKSMFWAGVPEKLTRTGQKSSKDEDREKPHAWRTYEELSLDQKRSLPWVDPRDRAGTSTKKELEPEPGLDVRVRHGGFRAEPDVMGFVPGADQVMPGKGGSTPSPEASLAASRAFSSKGPPVWSEQPIQTLAAWREEAAKRFKSSRDPIHARIIKDIEKELLRREEEPEVAVPEPQTPAQTHTQRVSEPEKARPTAHSMSAEERFGKRKRWGQTSRDVEVTRTEKPKK